MSIKFFFFFLPLFIFLQDAFAGHFIVRKVWQAQEMLEPLEMQFETADIRTPIIGKDKKIIGYRTKKNQVIGRPIFLAVWDKDEDKFYEIALMAAHPVSCKNYSFRVLTAGFRVEHVSGCGIGRIVFNVWKGNKKLIVLAGKHFWMPPEVSSVADPKILIEKSQIGIYTPYSLDLYDKQSIIEGFVFLEDEIKKAYADLRAKQVVSRAVPGKLLADAFPIDYLINLGINEQMDHFKFYRDPMIAADEILIETAYNRWDAFRWAISSANARGRYQFTNRGGPRGELGTYDTVVRAYEEADLIDDFEAGTQDLQNMLKIAVCLLDMELAKFPQEVHELFATDYRKAAIYPSAAYNGGYGVAKNLYGWIKKNKKEIRLDKFDIPAQAFTYTSYRSVYARNKQGKLVRSRIPRRVVNTETPVYLEKQMYLWKFIDDLRKKISGQP